MAWFSSRRPLLGEHGMAQPVWHCSLRAAPEDRMLSDDEWAVRKSGRLVYGAPNCAHQAWSFETRRDWHVFGTLRPELSAQAKEAPDPRRSRTSEASTKRRSPCLTAPDRKLAAPILLP